VVFQYLRNNLVVRIASGIHMQTQKALGKKFSSFKILYFLMQMEIEYFLSIMLSKGQKSRKNSVMI